MNSELNDYKLNNPDGADKRKYGEQKISYLNDDSRYVKENPVENQAEWDNSVPETTDGNTKESSATENADLSVQNGDNKSSPIFSSTISSVSSFVSSVGGSIGAVAGGIAASVMTAVIVVAVFVSTLTVNVSLVMAGMYSLIFKVELTGAQEEDFATPIFAILEGDNGFYIEQQITPDSVYITFDNLEPSKEYVITVKNEEKVFVQKVYSTATERLEKGFISAWREEREIFVYVEMTDLKENEHYTVRAYDDSGKTVFVKDDAELSKDFSFVLSEPKNLYFTLSVGGTVVSFCQIEYEPEPEKEPYNVTWSWGKGYESATATFTYEDGGEPFTVSATVQSQRFGPTCEEDGYILYSATAEYGGQRYGDSRTVVEEGTALGHEYGEPEFVWEQNPTGGYTVTAKVVCSHNANHFIELPDVSVSQDGEIYYAEVLYNEKYYNDEYPHYDYDSCEWTWADDYSWAYVTVTELHGSEPIQLMAEISSSEIEPTCEESGKTIYSAYISGTELYDEQVVENGEPALGHEFDGEPTFEWEQEATGGYKATAVFRCTRNQNHTERVEAEVTESVIETSDGYNTVYTATVIYNNNEYSDEKIVEN